MKHVLPLFLASLAAAVPAAVEKRVLVTKEVVITRTVTVTVHGHGGHAQTAPTQAPEPANSQSQPQAPQNQNHDQGQDQSQHHAAAPAPAPAPAPQPQRQPSKQAQHPSNAQPQGQSQPQGQPQAQPQPQSQTQPQPSSSSSSSSGSCSLPGFGSTLPGASHPFCCTEAAPCGTPQASGAEASFYQMNGGTGACGQSLPDSASFVAVNAAIMGSLSSGNPKNPLCGLTVTVRNTKTGKTAQGTVVDKCPGCKTEFGIDLSPGVFNQLAAASEGVFPVEWWFNKF